MASLGAFGLTIWAWGRGGWWRPVTRTLGVLLCEALVLGTVGVAVNRSLEIFPSWSALLDQDRPPPPPTTIVADPTTKLDVWLHDRASEGARSGLVFEWKSTEVKAWHLPAPPVIYVPPRYFTATTARFPVVLIIAPAHAGPAPGARRGPAYLGPGLGGDRRRAGRGSRVRRVERGAGAVLVGRRGGRRPRPAAEGPGQGAPLPGLAGHADDRRPPARPPVRRTEPDAHGQSERVGQVAGPGGHPGPGPGPGGAALGVRAAARPAHRTGDHRRRPEQAEVSRERA